MPVRIVIAEDDYLVREAVSRVLSDTPDFDIVASVADRGVRVASTLRETHPEVGVVVLSQHAEPEYVLQLLDGGSARRAYLLKERVRHRGQLVDAVRAV